MKIGDKVKIREDLKAGDIYDFHWGILKDMEKFKGQIATITRVVDNSLEYCYRINLDNGNYVWNDEMFDRGEQ